MIDYMLLAIILVLCVVIAYQIFMNYLTQKQSKERNIAALTFAYKNYEAERNKWYEERQQLLDRIQAPTFAEYKHQEVKVIKAKNGTDKPDIVIEQL